MSRRVGAGRLPLDHPDYPHGRRAGYVNGCRTKTYACPASPTCTDASTRLRRVRQLRRIEGRISPHDNVPSGPALAVLDRVFEAGLATPVLAKAAGLGAPHLLKLRASRPAWIKRGTADRILKAEPNVIGATPHLVPADHARRVMHALSAQGYSQKWVSRRIGLNQDWNLGRTHLQHVRSERYDKLMALAESLRDVDATPENSGIAQGEIDRTRARAARNGWRPYCFHGSDGAYDPRLDPDHPWSAIDSRCEEILTVAAALVRLGRDPEVDTVRVIADGCGTYEEEVQRMAGTLGVGAKNQDRVKNAADVRDVLDRVDTGDLDLVRAVVDLRLASWEYQGGLIPRDHPAVADLAAEKKAARDAAKKAAREKAKATATPEAREKERAANRARKARARATQRAARERAAA